jgi:hypothetical protein
LGWATGHSVATLAKHYAGVITELKDQPRVPAADAIQQARVDASGQLRLGTEPSANLRADTVREPLTLVSSATGVRQARRGVR